MQDSGADGTAPAFDSTSECRSAFPCFRLRLCGSPRGAQQWVEAGEHLGASSPAHSGLSSPLAHLTATVRGKGRGNSLRFLNRETEAHTGVGTCPRSQPVRG